MKKLIFSLVVILTFVFATESSAQVNRDVAINRLQSEVIELTADPSFELDPQNVGPSFGSVTNAFPKPFVANRASYHNAVLEQLLSDTSISTSDALVRTFETFANQHTVDNQNLARLDADVRDLLD